MKREGRDRGVIEEDRCLDLDVEFAGEIPEHRQQRERVESEPVEGGVGIDGAGVRLEIPGDAVSKPFDDVGLIHAGHGMIRFRGFMPEVQKPARDRVRRPAR